MTPVEQFKIEKRERITSFGSNNELNKLSQDWLKMSMAAKYVYNFEWLGRPIIQYPQDIVAVQELIWEVKPDLIIETGIAHGGSLILSASMLAMLDVCDALEQGRKMDPKASNRKVIGIDIDIRSHNLRAIQNHPMSNWIMMLEGSSVENKIINQVYDLSKKYPKIMVFLDSNHTHEHVLRELEAYALLTSVGSYCVVFDTFVEDVPDNLFPDRPWSPGNNPKTAVHEYLDSNENFQIDRSIQNKLQITVAPDGFLKRVK